MGKQYLDKDGLEVVRDKIDEARQVAAGAMGLAQAAFDNGSGSSYTDVYSETEFKTNKTFDNKPVYRRFINDESRLGNLTYLNIYDVETPIYCYYHFIENNEIVKEVQGLTVKFGFNNNNITFTISNTLGKRAFAALIEYTKTTD